MAIALPVTEDSVCREPTTALDVTIQASDSGCVPADPEKTGDGNCVYQP